MTTETIRVNIDSPDDLLAKIAYLRTAYDKLVDPTLPLVTVEGLKRFALNRRYRSDCGINVWGYFQKAVLEKWRVTSGSGISNNYDLRKAFDVARAERGLTDLSGGLYREEIDLHYVQQEMHLNRWAPVSFRLAHDFLELHGLDARSLIPLYTR